MHRPLYAVVGDVSGRCCLFFDYRLTLSSGSPTFAADNTTVWYGAHGRLSATIVPEGGNFGNSAISDVTVTVSF
jgi:hypothetical protein